MKDEKIIRKYYGEQMWQFCRSNFSTILEEEDTLSNLITSNFNESKNLYNHLLKTEQLNDFRNYILNLYSKKYMNKSIYNIKTPKELLDEAGYDLYECNTTSDVQSFRKYYKPNEELCTFHNDRLKHCYIYFAVKKDVDSIKRKDFKHPRRQDLYGTSVISIQFTRDKSHILSIKNRYNHIVMNPDATFSNNLDNIIPGLTDSFDIHYGMKQLCPNVKTDFDGLIRATNGKYYKYNYCINAIYYCDNNIIIDSNYLINKYSDKSRYILIDYFIIDLKEKKCILYDKMIEDNFLKSFNNINKIEIKNHKDYKEIITNIFYLKIDKSNKIIEYKNDKIEEIGFNFLLHNTSIQKINIPNVKTIGSNFLFENQALEEIDLPNVEFIRNYFLTKNIKINNINLPKLKKIGNSCLYHNNNLKNINLPNVKTIGNNFLYNNNKVESLKIPQNEKIGIGCLLFDEKLKQIELSNKKIDIELDYSCNKYLEKKIKLQKIKYMLTRIKEYTKDKVKKMS